MLSCAIFNLHVFRGVRCLVILRCFVLVRMHVFCSATCFLPLSLSLSPFFTSELISSANSASEVKYAALRIVVSLSCKLHAYLPSVSLGCLMIRS